MTTQTDTTSPAPTPGRRAWRAAALPMLLAMVAPLLLGLPSWGPVGSTAGFHGVAGSKDRAARAMPSPKVILVAGSSGAFGVDTPTLAARLNVPVANDALHAGIGIDQIAAWASRHVRAGDHVVLAPEWAHFAPAADADPYDPIRLGFLARYGGDLGEPGGVPPHAYRAARARAISWTEDARTSWIVFVNRSLGRDRRHAEDHGGVYGDPTALDDAGNLKLGRRPGLRAPEKIPFTTPEGLAKIWRPAESRAAIGLDALAAACRREGATLYVMPPIRIRPPGAPPGRFARFEEEWLAFAAARAGARPLSPPGGTELPAELGFDTEYHLNDRGALEMTDRLAIALQAAIDAGPTTMPAR